MNNNYQVKGKTMVNFVLDETGSMKSFKQQTIEGFNSFLKFLKEQEAEILFTLTKFNSDRIALVHKAEEIRRVGKLNERNYSPNACTPLYDAIGKTIKETEETVDSDKGKTQVLCVIMTDGFENNSKKYSRSDIFDLVSRKKTEGWTFVFLGADQDAWAAGEAIGLDRGNVADYSSSKTKETFEALSDTTKTYIERGSQQTKTYFTDIEDVPKSPEARKNVSCKNCGCEIRLPLNRGKLKVECRLCGQTFKFIPGKGVD